MAQPQDPPKPSAAPSDSEPIPRLIDRIRTELAADFPSTRRTRISRAPGRLDVMGGIADYTGATVCEMPLDRAAAVAMQPRDDRQIQVFSFNLYDEQLPFTFRMPLDAIAAATVESLRRDFAEPGRRWAGYIAGCLFILHEQKLIDLANPSIRGMSLALLSTVPMGAGIASSAAIELATMMNLVDHFGLRNSRHKGLGSGAQSLGESATPGPTLDPRPQTLDPLSIAALCQQVENRIVGAPCGVMDQVTSIAGEAGSLLRLACQPRELLPPLRLPDGIRVLGINSRVRHSVSGNGYVRTRCAAFMGHRMILQHIRDEAAAQNMSLSADPLHGYLANLDPDDYKSIFRPLLPATMNGQEFLARFGPTIDKATAVNPSKDYHVQLATDHHVFEARRVQQFIEVMEQAASIPATDPQRRGLLRKAGHLMYASHLSYSNNALLGAPECDLLVELVKQHESLGLYGAKITGGGSGGTVAILADKSDQSDQAIGGIMAEYEKQTGRKPEAFAGTSPGAWHFGTILA